MKYYVHGYLSEPNSAKGTLLKEKLGVIPIKYRDCPPEELVIGRCVENIVNAIKNDEHAILIGSSLGGFLAAKAALIKPVRQLILINPAIIPMDENIMMMHDMPQSILKDIQDEHLFTTKIASNVVILVGTEDDVVPNRWSKEFSKAQDAKILFFDDDHSFSKYLEDLPNILIHLLDEKD